jgi:hypothetical protein
LWIMLFSSKDGLLLPAQPRLEPPWGIGPTEQPEPWRLRRAWVCFGSPLRRSSRCSYSPEECVEDAFCEVRLQGVLGSSPVQETRRDDAQQKGREVCPGPFVRLPKRPALGVVGPYLAVYPTDEGLAVLVGLLVLPNLAQPIGGEPSILFETSSTNFGARPPRKFACGTSR